MCFYIKVRVRGRRNTPCVPAESVPISPLNRHDAPALPPTRATCYQQWYAVPRPPLYAVFPVGSTSLSGLHGSWMSESACALSNSSRCSCLDCDRIRRDRSHRRGMEALGGLALAERDIRALSTARTDRARSGDSPPARPRLTGRARGGRAASTFAARSAAHSPFGQWRVAPRAPRPSSPPEEQALPSPVSLRSTGRQGRNL